MNREYEMKKNYYWFLWGICILLVITACAIRWSLYSNRYENAVTLDNIIITKALPNNEQTLIEADVNNRNITIIIDKSTILRDTKGKNKQIFEITEGQKVNAIVGSQVLYGSYIDEETGIARASDISCSCYQMILQ